VGAGKRESCEEAANLVGAVKHLIPKQSQIDAGDVNDQLASMFEDAPQVEVAQQQDYFVLEENWAAINLFLRLQTQWQYISGMAGAVRTGLNYQAAEVVMRRVFKNEDHDTLFDKLQTIERAALSLLNGE